MGWAWWPMQDDGIPDCMTVRFRSVPLPVGYGRPTDGRGVVSRTGYTTQLDRRRGGNTFPSNIREKRSTLPHPVTRHVAETRFRACVWLCCRLCRQTVSPALQQVQILPDPLSFLNVVDCFHGTEIFVARGPAIPTGPCVAKCIRSLTTKPGGSGPVR